MRVFQNAEIGQDDLQEAASVANAVSNLMGDDM